MALLGLSAQLNCPCPAKDSTIVGWDRSISAQLKSGAALAGSGVGRAKSGGARTKSGTARKALPHSDDSYTEWSRGDRLEDRGRWSDALEYFAHSYKLDGHISSYLGMVRCHTKLKQFDIAFNLLKEGKIKFKDEKDLHHIYEQEFVSCQEGGFLERLQLARRNFVRRFPKDPEVKVILEQIKYYDDDFKNTRKLEAQKAVPRTQGWYPWMQYSELPAMPIKCYVGSDNSFPANSNTFTKTLDQQYCALARKAYEQWASACSGELQFQFVDKPTSAQLRCEWTMDAKKRYHSWSAGEDHSPNKSTNVARIFIDPVKPRSPHVFHHICLHEVGHGLGLNHSSQPGDVMYSHWADAPTNLSSNDIFRIRQLYTIPFLGRRFAERFVHHCFVERNFEIAYHLLSEEEQARMTLPQFEERVSNAIAKPISPSFELKKFERSDIGSICTYGFLLPDSNSDEQIYLFIAVKFEPDESSKIHSWQKVVFNNNM